MSQLDQVLAGLPRDFTLQFFVTFARFEYALMYAGYVADRRRRAEPDWSQLAEVLGEGFFSAVAGSGNAGTLINDPPKRLVLDEGNVKFGRRPPPVRSTSGLLASARQVRNNLFHGNKMFAFDRQRDQLLMSEALWVLDRVMESIPPIRWAFNET